MTHAASGATNEDSPCIESVQITSLVYFYCNRFYPSGWPRRGENFPVAAYQW